jgi:hypothetical protein
MSKLYMHTYPNILVIIRGDFHESKSEGYPLQGVNMGNEKKI